jgi:hypothetical protein
MSRWIREVPKNLLQFSYFRRCKRGDEKTVSGGVLVTRTDRCATTLLGQVRPGTYRYSKDKERHGRHRNNQEQRLAPRI